MGKTNFVVSAVIVFLTMPFCVAESVTSLEEQILFAEEVDDQNNQDDYQAEELPSLIGKQSKPTVDAASVQEVDELFQGPKEVPPEHILVVQRRYIHKEGQHEISPLFIGIQPADVFRKQIKWGFSYAYHFSEKWGIEALHASFLTQLDSNEDKNVLENAGLFVDRADPSYSIGASLLYTPLSSKVATKNEVNYFEGYFLLGGGISKFSRETAGMAMAGLGFRSYLSRRSIFKGEFRNYFDFLDGETLRRPNIVIGWSLLFGGGQ